MNKIIVERETFESKGKTYYTYFIKGQVRGKDVRVAVIPPDKGGYAVQTVGEDGEIYECAIKPYRSSDKTLLNMLLR